MNELKELALTKIIHKLEMCHDYDMWECYQLFFGPDDLFIKGMQAVYPNEHSKGKVLSFSANSKFDYLK